MEFTVYCRKGNGRLVVYTWFVLNNQNKPGVLYFQHYELLHVVLKTTKIITSSLDKEVITFYVLLMYIMHCILCTTMTIRSAI
ncbi:hypothetical protein SAMN05660235_00537 [Sporolituus thermophilus DSM 23256]|uniref:Uncharacterized protein n=1 Tax=Sporolituus thermophilus DSM 23256 TaxID=1123285 RepID=A0A1G7IMC6_9FIRM|nr:hypothetical protein SAMN05660235_00537 [Sporolituus thermophilus DSM 23256]